MTDQAPPRPVFPTLAAAWEDWARTAGEGGEPLSEEARDDLRPVFMFGAVCLHAMILTMPKDPGGFDRVLTEITQEVEAFIAESEEHLLDSGDATRH